MLGRPEKGRGLSEVQETHQQRSRGIKPGLGYKSILSSWEKELKILGVYFGVVWGVWEA